MVVSTRQRPAASRYEDTRSLPFPTTTAVVGDAAAMPLGAKGRAVQTGCAATVQSRPPRPFREAAKTRLPAAASVGSEPEGIAARGRRSAPYSVMAP